MRCEAVCYIRQTHRFWRRVWVRDCIYSCPSPVPLTEGGIRGSLPRAPNARGPPNSAGLVRIRCVRQSHSSQDFFKGLVSLYFRLKSACSFALRFMLLAQIMRKLHNYLARVPVRRTSETANRRRQLVGIYVLCACTKKEPQGPPEHTSEHIKSQNLLGRAPRPPYTIHFVGAHFLDLPWAPQILSAALPESD